MNSANPRRKQTKSPGITPAELARTVSRRTPGRIWPWAAAFVLVAGLTVFVSGQQRGQMANPQSNMNVPILTSGSQEEELPGLPDDWSFRHLNFTDPGTEEDAINAGRHEEWLRIVNEPRYIIQQLKRRQPAQGPWAEYVAKMNKRAQMQEESGEAEPILVRAGQLEAASRPVKGHRPIKPLRAGIDRDWSMDIGAGAAASFTATVAAPASGNISGSSTLTVDGVPLDASAPSKASASGTFTANPANNSTVVIGGQTFTAKYDTQANNGSITVGTTLCIAPGAGIYINGNPLTTNANAGTSTLSVATNPSNGDTVAIGGVTYNFESTLSGTTPANQVLIGSGSTSTTNRERTAQNLSVAINNTGTCGSTQSGACTRNVSGANLEVSSTNTGSSTTETLTSLCANNASIAGTNDSTRVTGTTVAAATSAGSNSSTTFALNSSAGSGASQSAVTSNLIAAINTTGTISGLVTASSGGTGVVDLVADTWGTTGNYALTYDGMTSSSGITLVSLSNGANVSNSSSVFAIDNNYTDAASNLVAALTANGATGVTPSQSGAMVTLTATNAGSSGNLISVTNNMSSAFSLPAGDLTGGSDGTTSGTTFAYWSGSADISQSALASNIAYAINNNSTLETLVSATSNTNASNNLTITALAGGTAGNSYTVTAGSFTAFSPTSGSLSGGTGAGLAAGQSPAKYSLSTTSASCTDYVVYPTGATGSSGQATIVAYTNLYGTSTTGCGGAVPEVYWAYNTPVGATNGIATLSPVIDWSGTQVAFVETVSGTAYLVLLRMANSGGTVTTATSETAAQYYNGGNGCAAPCYTTFTLGAADSNSPPFYDYANDAIYVGNDSGSVYKFSGAFKGTPAQAWSMSVSSHTNKHMTGPVVDPQSPNYIYVCDNSGYLFSLTASNGAVNGTSSQMDFNVGFTDAPLVDSSSTTSYIYTFGQHSGTGTYINRFVASSAVSGTGTALRVSTTATSTLSVYDGAFDNLHISYSSGNLYWCANANSSNTYPTLWRIPMNTSFNGTPVAVETLTSAAATCSPVTEFDDGTNDWLFLSVTTGGNQTSTSCSGSTAACLYNFNASTALTSSSKATSGIAVAGGASGVVVDNNVPSTTLAGASQIYFSSLGSETCSTSGGTGACAVQASQSNPSGPVYGTGTVTISAPIGLFDNDSVTIGPSGSTITYTAESNGSSCGGGPCFWEGTSNDDTGAQSLYAAITNNPSNCPTPSLGTWQYTCFSNITTANPYVSATWSSGSAIVNLTNTLGSNLVFTAAGTAGDITLSPNNGILP